MRVTIAALIAASACSGAQSKQGSDTPPVLQVTSPTRGTTTDGTMVTVTGTVTDDGPVHVTVQGTDVTPASDGSFTTTISVPPGLSLIETHAIDKGGHDVRDVRAVLAGATGMSDGSLGSPIGAQASPAALRQIATTIANDAEHIDYTAAVQHLNPIYNNSSCLGAVVNITHISIGSIDAAMVPGNNAVITDVTLNNVVVTLQADFRVACIGGSDTITLSSSAAHIHGNLGLSASAGKISTSLPNASITLDNFNLNVGGIPGPIVDLFNGVVRGRVESALSGMISNKVPPLADAKIANLLTRPYTITVLGHKNTVTVSPDRVNVSSSGLFLGATTTLTVIDGEGGVFAPMPMALPPTLMANSQGIGLAIATDLVNELLAGLWAASAFDRSLPISKVAVLAALLDPDAATIDLHMMLPPQIIATSDSKLQLSVGDAMISVKDMSGAELQKIALSVNTTLVAGPSQSDKLLLTVGQPTVYADVIQQDPNSTQLTDQQIEGIVNGVWGLVGDTANQALANLPMPSLAGLQLGAPTIAGMPGFVTADIALQ
jgi:hypothetical protein